MRPIVFALGVAWLVWRLSKDSSYAAAAAAYFYFAIPGREFFVPNAPYQAGCWALAVLLSVRYSWQFTKDIRAELQTDAAAAGRRALEFVAAALTEGIVQGKLRRKPELELQGELMATVRTVLTDQLPTFCAARLLEVTRVAVERTAETAIASGMAEADRLISLDGGRQTRGGLVAQLMSGVSSLVQKTIRDTLPVAIERGLGTAHAEYEQFMRLRETGDEGPLGVPVPRGGFTALITNPGIYLHILFTFATYVSTSYARWSTYVAEKQIGVCWLLFIPLIAIVFGIRHVQHWKLFTWAWLLGVCHLAYNGITLWLRFGGRADDVGGQAGDANWLGIICVSMATVGLGMFVGHRERLPRLAGLVGAGFCALGVIACGSRGALVALVVGVGYWFMWTNRKGVAAGLLAMGAAGFLVVAPTEFWDRMGTMLLGKESNPWITKNYEASAQSRTIFWQIAIEAFKESPIVGIGPMNFPKENAERGLWVDPGTGLREFMTHSTWLQLLSEYGLLGSIPWIGAYAFSLWCAFRATQRARVLRGDPKYGWLPAYLVGFQAGWVGNAVAISFVSSQWLDFNFWIMVFGPLTLEVTDQAVRERAWFQVEGPQVKRPPPRYAPPTALGLDLGRIDAAAQAEPTLPLRPAQS